MGIHHRNCFQTLHPVDYQCKTGISSDLNSFASLRCSGYPLQQQQQHLQQPGSGHRLARQCDLQQVDARTYAKTSMPVSRHQPSFVNSLRSSGGCGRQATSANEIDNTDRFFGGGRLTIDERSQRSQHQAAASSNGVVSPDLTSPYNVTSLYSAACADQRQAITVAMTTCFQSGCGSLMF
jgi:hypothetical protein